MTELIFSSYLQGPLSGAIPTVENFGTLPAPTFTPSVTVTGPGSAGPVGGPALRMLGPGDVAALVSGAVRRVEPSAGASDVEPNYLAVVEVSPPELPWVLTPARPAGQRLRPWFVLAVLDGAGATLLPGDPLPIVTAPISQLPDLTDSWGWAHVQQAAGGGTLPGGGVAPTATVARLVCPRRLQPGITYRACLVPAFASGVAAGLGGAPVADGSHAPAWNVAAAGTVDLPVYHSWTFTTGPSGDFEDLMRRLKPADPEALRVSSGRRIDVREPWPDDVPLGDTAQIVTVQGALRPFTDPPVPDDAISDAVADTFDTRLRTQLDSPADRLAKRLTDGDVGALAPPIYGGRHVSANRVGEGPEWLAQLNTAVAHRIAAGIGAEYVRAHQEDLMAKAWEQVGAIREANRRRAMVELTSEVAEKVHARHVATLEEPEVVALAAPAAVRTRTSDETTLSMEIRMSRMPNAAATTAFVRRVRPASKLSRMTNVTVRSLVPRALTGQVTVPNGATVIPSPPVMNDAALPAVVSNVAARQLVTMTALARVATLNDAGAQTAMIAPTIGGLGLPQTLLRSISAGDRSAVAAGIAGQMGAVTDATSAITHQISSEMVQLGVAVPVGALARRIAAALAPGDSRLRRLATQITVPERFAPATGGDEVMACPVFPVPTALALLESDPEWFLPGLGALPTNRAALLRPNAEFIESFLVGMTHEMMRELLWREYPTDRRGTPFARFWPRPSGAADIPRLHTWDSGGLGGHLLQADGLAVLLVRGDVLRRYPDVVVTAVRSQTPDGAGRFRPRQDTAPVPPTFVVKVDDSTSAYAFEIPAEELVAPPSAQGPGWFFVFAEHSFRIRFGFDDPPSDGAPDPPFASWNDASWPREGGASNFVPVRRGHAFAGDRFDASPTEPSDARWNRDAADIARITLQRPFRVAIQAAMLIHPDSA